MLGPGGDSLSLLATAGALMALAGSLAAVFRGAALQLVYPVGILSAALALTAHAAALFAPEVSTARLSLGLSGTGLRFRLDVLSAFFGVIINIGVIAACLYGLGLDRRSELTGRVEPFFAAFVIAMNAVLLADDAFFFLFSWELMSLASWALVVSRHEDPLSRQAGHIYLLMAAFGTAALLMAFGAMAGAAGGLAFDDIRGGKLTAATAGIVLGTALIGAGSKAGVMPLHAWLPLAHPAAPSHVSALMSGVMTKVAIYGLIRIVFDLIGAHQQWWWSLPFILLGSLTAVHGLLQAVLDQDLKRVLAYSTIENIGVIFVGIGFAIAFKTSGISGAAAIAMAAALLHALNHSWFKSLLFLGAGAVLHSTGGRDLERFGGLIHRMPQTAVFFLVGAFAISAMPPLNGFVSEWLLFQAVLAGPQFPEPVLRFVAPAIGAMLAFSAALAAACFVRAFGMTFLGRARSTEAAEAHEAPLPARIAMGMLAALCIAGGVLGSVLVSVIAPLLDMTVGARLPMAANAPTPWALVPLDVARSVYDAPIIMLFVVASTVVTILIVHRVSERRTRMSAAWDCGYPEPSVLTQYSASSFAQPLRRMFGSVAMGVTEKIDMPAPGDIRAASLEVKTTDYLWRWLYERPAAFVLGVSERLNVMQFLSIRHYLVAVFATLVILLVVTAGVM